MTSKFTPGADHRDQLVATLLGSAAPNYCSRVWQSLALAKPDLHHLSKVITGCRVDSICWYAWEIFQRRAASDPQYREHIIDIVCKSQVSELSRYAWEWADNLTEPELVRVIAECPNDEVQKLAWKARGSTDLSVEALISIASTTDRLELAVDCWNQLVEEDALTQTVLCELMASPVPMVARVASLEFEKGSTNPVKSAIEDALAGISWDT